MTQAEIDDKATADREEELMIADGFPADKAAYWSQRLFRHTVAARLDERRRIQGGGNSFKWDDFNDWLNAFIPRLSAREQGMASKAFEAARETFNAPSDQSGERDYWLCRECGERVEGSHVTLEERHIGCGGECY